MASPNSFYINSKPIIDDAEELTLSIIQRLKAVARKLVNNPDELVRINEEIARLEANLNAYEQAGREWTDENLSDAYLRGIKGAGTGEVIAGFSMVGLLATGGGGGFDISDTAKEILEDYPEHWTAYRVFQNDAYQAFNQSRLPIVRDTQDKIRELIIQASEASYRDADTFTRRQMTQELMNRFADEGITGIRYSNGRTMKIDSYAELVARTQTKNAWNEASWNRLQQYGMDLVVISVHYPTSPMCEPYQGGVYSISGTSEQYPSLESAINGGAFHANCYIKDMELYTNEGWKKFAEINGSEQVMSLNPETLIPEWCGITEKHAYHHKGEMIEMKSNSFDLCVTPDHDLFIGYKGRQGKKRISKYKFCKADEAIDRAFFTQLRCVEWEGEEQEPPISGISSIDFAKLLAWYLSDGHVDKTSVRIAKSKEKHVSVLKETLEPLGFYHDGVKFTFYKKEWAEYFKQFGKAHEKFLPDWILNAKKEVIQAFIEAYAWGDGSIKKSSYKGFTSKGVTFFTTSDKLADQLGEAILKAGKYPSFTLMKTKGVAVEHHNGTYVGNYDTWRISANNIRESYYNSTPSQKHQGIQAEKIPYDDMVYCVTLEKNHVMWVRRNGKTTWSGNCKHTSSGFRGDKPATPVTRERNEELYEIQQRQRAIERKIRTYKRRKAAAITEDERDRAQKYISKWQKEARENVKKTDLVRRAYQREQI